MADKKITALNENTTGLTTDDLFHVVDSPASSPSNKKITANTVFQKVPSWIGYAGTGIQAYTSATAAVTATGGLVLVTTPAGSTIPALADGAAGQQVTFVLDVDGGGTSVITPTTKTGFATATLSDVGDSVTMIFTTTRGWIAIASVGGSSDSDILA